MLLQGFTGAFGLMRKCHGEGWAVGDGEIWVIGEGDDGLCGSGLQGYFHKRIFIQGLASCADGSLVGSCMGRGWRWMMEKEMCWRHWSSASDGCLSEWVATQRCHSLLQ